MSGEAANIQHSIDSAKRLAQLLLEDPHLTQKTRTVVDTVVRNLKWLQRDLHQNGPNENLKVIVAELTDTLDQLIPSESQPQHDWRPDWYSVGERAAAAAAEEEGVPVPEEDYH